jgi:hypothetical protein
MGRWLDIEMLIIYNLVSTQVEHHPSELDDLVFGILIYIFPRCYLQQDHTHRTSLVHAERGGIKSWSPCGGPKEEHSDFSSPRFAQTTHQQKYLDVCDDKIIETRHPES